MPCGSLRYGGSRPAGPLTASGSRCSSCCSSTRLWVLATLGPRWTTRIVILPGAPLVTGGPYRFVKHPNYVVVAGEIAALPLAFGLWPIAALFSLLNAAVLAIRIREEERALSSLRA